jgi:modulator of FtsH protease HflC
MRMNARRKSLWLVLALICLMIAFTCLFTVQETETAIVTRFGRPLSGVAGSGLHVKYPWPIDTVVRLDRRTLLFDNEPIEMLSQDKKNVLVDSFVCWRIFDPLRFAQTVKTRIEAEARLFDVSASELGAAVGNEPIEAFINVGSGGVKLREVSERVGDAVNNVMRGNFGIEVVDLQINGLQLPAQNRESVIGRMRAERDRIATKYRSEGEEEALKIEAEATAARERILAESRGRAESIRGTGEARALELFAKAYAQDPEFYRFLKTMQTYEAIIDDRTTIFLPSDSKLMGLLDGG